MHYFQVVLFDKYSFKCGFVILMKLLFSFIIFVNSFFIDPDVSTWVHRFAVFVLVRSSLHGTRRRERSHHSNWICHYYGISLNFGIIFVFLNIAKWLLQLVLRSLPFCSDISHFELKWKSFRIFFHFAFIGVFITCQTRLYER